MSTDGQFVTAPSIVRGLPWWFFKQIILCIIPYFAIAIVLYDMPWNYPSNAEDVDTEGIDPDTLEMTPMELNMRLSYGASSRALKPGLSSIRNTGMKEMGLNQPISSDKEISVPPEHRSSNPASNPESIEMPLPE
mmetsp:Transcript_6180/g.7780  ORF Transcript_6180/g.7780 Transcript_6180/m.7780 type:complete len:135 (-) Transcript_6180:271-675(-)